MAIVSDLLFALLPSAVKCAWLRRRGHTIGKDVRIGVSVLGVRHLELGDHSRIGHGNIFKGMESVSLGANASIGRFNLFTCNPHYYKLNPQRAGRLAIGARAAITMRHYIDVQDRVELGEDSLIAGIQTMVFTHQKGLSSLNEFKPVRIGRRVYIGAGCRILPGTTVADCIVVGAGSIVGGHLSETFQLYSSPRAVAVKQLNRDMPYFTAEWPSGPNEDPGAAAQ